MLNEDRVHDEVSTFGLGGTLGVAHERSVASALEPSGIGLEIAKANHMSFGTFGSSVEDVIEDDAVLQLMLAELT